MGEGLLEWGWGGPELAGGALWLEGGRDWDGSCKVICRLKEGRSRDCCPRASPL